MKTSLAKMLFDILSNVKRKFKLHDKHLKVMEFRYHFREVSEAKSHNVKMMAIGFKTKKKQLGIGSYYSFIADPLLRPKIAAHRFFCSCEFCSNKLSLPTVSERYDGPFDRCKYWPVFAINANLGWNDIRVISFEPGKGCNDEELAETFVAAVRELGKTIPRSVMVGGIGAYGVDADDSDYYLVQWTEEPHMIEDDDVLLVGDPQIQIQVFTGNWVCNRR